MSFLSFLSSHRLHSSHRPWIDPLPMQLDLFVHELPHGEADEFARSLPPPAEADGDPLGSAREAAISPTKLEAA